MFVQFIATTTNCDRQRIYSIVRLLEDLYPKVNCYIDFKRSNPQITSDTNKIAIFQRVAFINDSTLNLFRNNNYKIVVELDDDPRSSSLHVNTQFRTYKIADAVIVSTETLKDFISQFNPNTFIFPNYLEHIPKFTTKNVSPLKIFFGAFNRQSEHLDILYSLNKLVDQYSLEVEVLCNETLFNQLNTTQKFYQDKVPYSVYLSIMKSCHVALMPLTDNEFNRCKSDLKFIEAASLGTVALASPVVYENTIEHGKTGLIYHNAKEFESYLEQLIIDSELRESLALNAYNYVVSNRHLNQHIGSYYEILNLISRLPQKNR